MRQLTGSAKPAHIPQKDKGGQDRPCFHVAGSP
jgi:hypothetical protein